MFLIYSMFDTNLADSIKIKYRSINEAMYRVK